MPIKYDVLGIGNAIMDVIAPVPDKFLTDNAVEKGAMTLIDESRALELHKKFSALATPQEIAGGSAANTLVGIAGLGVRAAYVGKVANDGVGDRFADGMNAAGVAYNTKRLMNQDATARCLIAVTDDGERSMNTFLGASVRFKPSDIVADQVKSSTIIYLEGYLFDQDEAKAAFVKASEIAQAADRTVSLTLSDTFCVDRHRASFKHLIKNHTDILFANESELLSLYETDDFSTAITALREDCRVGFVTRSAKGSVVIEGDALHTVPAVWADNLVDTTGAGDQYAAGVLSGHIMGMSWKDAAYLGSHCAAEVISHFGARPEQSVHNFIVN